MTLGDRVFDQGLEGGRAQSDVFVRMVLLHLAADHGALVCFFAERIAQDFRDSIAALQALRASGQYPLESREGELLTYLLSSLEDALPLLGSIASTGRPAGEDRHLSTLLWDELDARACQAQKHRSLFLSTLQSEADELDKVDSLRYRQINESIESAFDEQGVERREGLRECLKRLREFIRDVPAQNCRIAWLQYIWLLQLVNEDFAEAALAAKMIGPVAVEEDLVYPMALRVHAQAKVRQSELAAAYALTLQSVKAKADVPTLIEAAHLSALSGQPHEGRQLVDNALYRSPVAIGELLASRYGDSLIALCLHAVNGMRSGFEDEIRRELTQWSRALRLARDTESLSGLSFNLPTIVTDEPKEAVRDLASIGLLSGYGVKAGLIDARLEIIDTVKHDILVAEGQRQRELEEARAELEAAWAKREESVRQAAVQHAEATEVARQSIEGATDQGERAQQGCTMALGFGCATMTLYVGLAAVLALSGTQLSLKSPLGMAALLVAGIPIVMAIFSQVGYSLKRAAIDAELAERVRASQRAYEEASRTADELYRSKIDGLRAQVSKAEEAMRKLQDAKRLVAQGNAA